MRNMSPRYEGRRLFYFYSQFYGDDDSSYGNDDSSYGNDDSSYGDDDSSYGDDGTRSSGGSLSPKATGITLIVLAVIMGAPVLAYGLSACYENYCRKKDDRKDYHKMTNENGATGESSMPSAAT